MGAGMFSDCLIVSLGTILVVEEDSFCGLIARNFEVDSSIVGVLEQPETKRPKKISIILLEVFIMCM
jgi:hypothetical protein